MRRDLPFQEVVPLDKGIAVINAQQWYLDKIKIALISNDRMIQEKKFDETGNCLFQDLSNDKQYTVEIKRTDLKGIFLYKKLEANVAPRKGGVKYVVLVGASVGKRWEFPKLPERVNIGNDIFLGNRTKYDFDKSAEIDALCKLKIPASYVIIKECAAYFPRELTPSKQQIIKWVEKLRSYNITPILATVVPITKTHDNDHPGKLSSILGFNDFIRDYASKEGIAVLDLEKAVRISDKDRHLRDEYAQPDGLHLLKTAYDEALDKIVLPVIQEAL